MAAKLPVPKKEEFLANVEKFPNTELAKMYGVEVSTISKWRELSGCANVWKFEMLNREEFVKDSSELRWPELSLKYGAAKSTMTRWKMLLGLTNGKKGDRKVVWIEGPGGCWLCTSHKVGGTGYPQGSVKKGRRSIARVMWCEKFGEWPDGLEMLHSCDNRRCINPDHVRPGTKEENGGEMAERDRSAWGERSGMHKLSSEEAKKVFDLKGKMPQRKVGKLFGVSGSTIFHIWNGTTWRRDVEGKENFPVHLTKDNLTYEDVLRMKGFISSAKQLSQSWMGDWGKKLVYDDVLAIRNLQGKASLSGVAKAYGVSRMTISHIWTRKTWRKSL